jgi:hypothetical protein
VPTHDGGPIVTFVDAEAISGRDGTARFARFMVEERLSFTLRPVESRADLLLACRVRAAAYGRKNPAYGEAMLEPDRTDASPWTTVFVCEDRITGEPVGTARVQATTRGGEIEIEKYVEPPAHILRYGRGEISRLAAVLGADPFVRLALWKASYLYCLAVQVRWMVLGVGKPSLPRAYQSLGATDIFEDRRQVVLGHGGNKPYRILGLEITACEHRMRAENHPLCGFMFDTVHRDITVVPAPAHGDAPAIAPPGRGAGAARSVDRDVAEQVRLHVVDGSGEFVQRV